MNYERWNKVFKDLLDQYHKYQDHRREKTLKRLSDEADVLNAKAEAKETLLRFKRYKQDAQARLNIVNHDLRPEKVIKVKTAKGEKHWVLKLLNL